MKRRFVVAIIGLCASIADPASGHELTLDQRIEAQRAMERVYWSHRNWPTENPGSKPSFEMSLPIATLHFRVDNGLRKATALSSWGAPITSAEIQAELTRIGAETNDPRILRELFHALHDDPFLIAECLVRPRLADRRIREHYAWDDRFHRAMHQKIETFIAEARRIDSLKQPDARYVETTWTLAADGGVVEPRRTEYPSVISLSRVEWDAKLSELERLFGTKDAAASSGFTPNPTGLVVGRISPLQEARESFYVVAVLKAVPGAVTTATVAWPKEPFDAWWGAAREAFPVAEVLSKAIYTLPSFPDRACVADTWRPLAPTTTEARYYHTAVWTGAEMIVWGGFVFGAVTSGARYDPATDSWTATSMGANLPGPLHRHSAVWTGTEMIVWGGTRYLGDPSSAMNTGARYDPTTDSWTPTSFTGTTLPARRSEHEAVWTGTQMIVWGGKNHFGTGSNTGDLYTPATNTWSPMATAGAPTGRWRLAWPGPAVR